MRTTRPQFLVVLTYFLFAEDVRTLEFCYPVLHPSVGVRGRHLVTDVLPAADGRLLDMRGQYLLVLSLSPYTSPHTCQLHTATDMWL